LLPPETSHAQASTMKISLRTEDRVITATLIDNETKKGAVYAAMKTTVRVISERGYGK